MAQISLNVHGRSYQVTCDDGQESHLLQLAQHIDGKMGELEGSVGQVGEQRLLFMACLLIADELFDAQRQVDGLKAAARGPPPRRRREAPTSKPRGPSTPAPSESRLLPRGFRVPR